MLLTHLGSIIHTDDRNLSITAILVQRFLLHLQSAEHQALDLTSSHDKSRSSSIVFDQMIGSLGTSLPPESFLGVPEDGVGEEQ